MKVLAFIFLLGVLISNSRGDVLPNTASPDGQFEISSNEGDIFMTNAASGKSLGSVLPASQENQISNVVIHANWSPDSRKVVVLIGYGTKLTEVFLFTIGEKGQLYKVTFEQPDLEKIFINKIDSSLSSYDEDYIGRWLSNATFSLIIGRETDGNLTTHFVVPVKVTVSRNDAETIVGKPEVLDDDGLASFLKAWQ